MAEFKIPEFKKIKDKQNPLISPIAKAKPDDNSLSIGGPTIGIPAMPHIQGTDQKDYLNISSEINKSAIPNAVRATVDGGQGNDTFIVDLNNTKAGSRFFINDADGKNRIHIVSKAYHSLPILGDGQISAVQPSLVRRPLDNIELTKVDKKGTLYMLKVDQVEMIIDAKQIFRVTFDSPYGPRTLVKSKGSSLVLNKKYDKKQMPTIADLNKPYLKLDDHKQANLVSSSLPSTSKNGLIIKDKGTLA